MKALNALRISGREVFPIVEGGKGVSVSNGRSCGAFAASGCVGTFSGVNADFFDDDGRIVPQVYRGKTRRDRYEELVAFAIRGGIAQARVAYETSGGRGRIHMNVLWEAAASAARSCTAILEGAKGLIHGITCGAGMPYRVAEIASRFGVYCYPIVSSARAFRALWKRAYHSFRDVVWAASSTRIPGLPAATTALSNSEDPLRPEDPVAARHRTAPRTCGNSASTTRRSSWPAASGTCASGRTGSTIPTSGPIAFQFGTRPLLTKESPVSDGWKRALLMLKPGDVTPQSLQPDRLLLLGGQQRLPSRTDRAQRAAGRLQPRAGRRTRPRRSRSAPAGAPSTSPRPTTRRAAAWLAAGLHRGAAHAGFDAGLRVAGEVGGDPDRSAGLHGLPQRLPVQQLGGKRERHHRQAGRPALVLHPEDPAGDRPRRRCRAQPDVRRPQRLSLRAPIRSIRTASCRPSSSWWSASAPATRRRMRCRERCAPARRKTAVKPMGYGIILSESRRRTSGRERR